MALISEAISHKLAQGGVIVYLLDCLGHLVSPGANALASVREQDWWIVLPSITFAFARVPIYVSSCHLVPCPVWGTCSWLINQLNMTRMFTLLPGSSWTWGWCLCLLGGTGFFNYVSVLLQVCNYRSSYSNNAHDCLGFSTSCARLFYWFC